MMMTSSKSRAIISEKKLFQQSIPLLRALARCGLAPNDALAVAYNTVFLFHSQPWSWRLFRPRQLLGRYSYGEIASLCESIIAQSATECAVNKNYREDLA